MALYLKQMEHFSLLQKNSPKKELYRTQFVSMISLATTVDVVKKTMEQFCWWRSTNGLHLAPSHCKGECEGVGCAVGRVAALTVQPLHCAEGFHRVGLALALLPPSRPSAICNGKHQAVTIPCEGIRGLLTPPYCLVSWEHKSDHKGSDQSYPGIHKQPLREE